MKNDIVLVAWLIVLLRTREGNQVNFDWGYKTEQSDIQQDSGLKQICMGKVISTLQDKVGDAIATLSRNIHAMTEAQSASASGPVALIMSTSSLAEKSEESRDEVSRGAIFFFIASY